MKKYRLSEELGNIDEAFLEEVFEYQSKKRSIRMSKKKIVSIVIAAALVVSIGVTAVAASWSSLNQLSDYFAWSKETFRVPDEVPIIEDPEVYAKEVTPTVTTAQSDAEEAVSATTSEVKTYTPPAPGTAQITSVSATKHSIYMTIEFNAEGWDIPDEIPADARHDEEFGFEWADTNFWWSGGRSADVSRVGNIFTYVYSWNHIYEFPEDELVITLQRFGYITADKDFNTLRDIDVEVRLPVDEIDFMETITSKNTADLMGATYTAEISAYEFSVRTSIEDLVTNGLSDEIGYVFTDEMQDYLYRAVIEFHLTDGTAFTSNLGTYSIDDSSLITSRGALRNPDEGTSTMIYCFEVPIDISQVDYITLNDVPFYFSSAE